MSFQEGFRITRQPTEASRPKSDRERYDAWKNNPAPGLQAHVGPIIRHAYAEFLAAEDGKSTSAGVYQDVTYLSPYGDPVRVVRSGKAIEHHKTVNPESAKRIQSVGNHLETRADRDGIEVWNQETYGELGMNSGGESYNRSGQSGSRRTTRSFLLAEGDGKGNLFTGDKPAVSILATPFNMDNIQTLARLIAEKTGASVHVVRNEPLFGVPDSNLPRI